MEDSLAARGRTCTGFVIASAYLQQSVSEQAGDTRWYSKIGGPTRGLDVMLEVCCLYSVNVTKSPPCTKGFFF